ncbi:polysaccharidase protein [Enterococcus faecalis 62]|uniref:hypothetical protein n=1 Tax=Enterococcus faecalis TaxID=1351 RepID=UPI0001FFC13D|nr:hypothetical protein [Enterococcus faecalis]ADX80430.1 polysaccharidase protein [Enterococcus faecalis 62]EOJ62858.1 hypothetical protein WMQ_01812 [Enterococcus faecalis EnGen0350]MBE9440974.1 hypothetical protein [Enterococcus faecalis]MBE9443958.1 hypothetical protein [Enterococcus faecalis]MBE9449553.1 hypothetical protein [Enterococcus faecalis]
MNECGGIYEYKKIQIYFIATCCLISLSMLTKVAHAESNPIGNCYYVSSQRGSDTNSGLSISEPFKSLNKINELKLNPGDKVLLENGLVFEDQYLQIKNSENMEACIEISNSQESNIFVSPENGPVKPNFNYLTYDRFSQNTVFDGYKLEQSSPAIHSGKKVIDKNGYNLGTDFFGIKLDGILDIGAVKSSK